MGFPHPGGPPALLDTMHEGRLRRLRQAGFSEEQARTISDLHTPNFM